MSEMMKLAERLTDAQRADLLNGNCVYMGNPDCLCSSKFTKEFLAMGLTEERSPTGYTLSERGKALRAHLEGE
ncbi:hypothetical protein [Sphingobium indicum]|nr:hypothetical protein [Sphingobium indicum]